MATMNESFFAELLSPKAAKWSAGVAFDRSNGLPLDQWSVFQTKTSAEEYLSNSKAYPGQVIAYAEADGSMTACVLSQNTDGTALTLKPIGIIPSGDAKTIEVTADGQISIYGFGDATTGYLPRKAEDGTLEWVPISAVVQGDGNKITTLTSEDGSVTITKKTDTDTSLVYDLKVVHPDAPEYAIKKDERTEGATETTYHLTKDGENVDVAIVVPDAYNDTALAGRVKNLEDNKADKSTTYTKIEVDTAISTAVEGILGDDVKEAYNTLKEIQDILEGTDGEAIDGLIEVADANKQAIKVLNGDAETAGSVAKQIADAVAPLATASELERVEGIANSKQTAEQVNSAISTALADYTNTETLNDLLEGKVDDADLANYYTKEEIENKGYAVAKTVEETYATKQEIADAGYAVAETVNNELARKLEKVTIAHTSEGVAEGVTYSEDGKTANVVVDAYIKSETYTRGEVDTAITNKIKEFTGGESAADVLLALNDYKKANDTEIYGAEKVKEWTGEDGKYTPDYTKDSRIDANYAATQANAESINNLAIFVGMGDQAADASLAKKIAALETAVNVTVDGRLDAVEGALNGSGDTQGLIAIVTGHTTKIGNLETADARIEKKADDNAIAILALQNKVDTGNKNVSTYVADAIKAVTDTHLNKEQIEATYATITALDGVKSDLAILVGADKTDDGKPAMSVRDIVKAEVGSAGHLKREIVEALPEVENADADTIYMVKVANVAGDAYKEYMLIDGAFAQIGDTSVNLTGYATEDWVTDLVNNNTPAKFEAGKLGTILGAVDTVVDGKTEITKNVVYAKADGTGEVKAVSTDILVNGELELVLNGGNATGKKANA